MKVYRMPNGRTYRFADKEVPPGAVLVEKKAEKKEEETPVETKAKTTATKARKTVNKAKKVETK